MQASETDGDGNAVAGDDHTLVVSYGCAHAACAGVRVHALVPEKAGQRSPSASSSSCSPWRARLRQGTTMHDGDRPEQGRGREVSRGGGGARPRPEKGGSAMMWTTASLVGADEAGRERDVAGRRRRWPCVCLQDPAPTHGHRRRRRAQPPTLAQQLPWRRSSPAGDGGDALGTEEETVREKEKRSGGGDGERKEKERR